MPHTHKVLELQPEGCDEHFYVHRQTPEECRKAANEIYGEGKWKEILLDDTRKMTCPNQS